MTGRRDCQCPRSQHTHGTICCYQVCRCRCIACRAAYSAHRSTYSAGLVPIPSVWAPREPTRRRLQALHVIGWTDLAIGGQLNIACQAAAQLRTNPSPRILQSTAARVTALYDRTWNVYPEGASADRARSNALRLGWCPPLAWDDDELDDPAAAPHLPGTGPRELQPCGTAAAARRHWRNGEQLDEACRRAESRAHAERAA